MPKLPTVPRQHDNILLVRMLDACFPMLYFLKKAYKSQTQEMTSKLRRHFLLQKNERW